MPSSDSGRQGRRERPNDPGLLILTSLASGEKHGYALLLDIETFTGVRLGPGTLYGAIGRLEARGLIEPAGAEGRARPYRLTQAGRQMLESTLADLGRIVAEGLSRLHGQAPAPAAAGGFA